MLSRVADAVYWIGRYIERADSISRFVSVTAQLTLDLPTDRTNQWRALIIATGDDALFLERYHRFDRDNVLRFLVFDEKYHSSLWSCIRAARENARSVREIISSDVWTQINRAYLTVKKAVENPDATISDPGPFLRHVEDICYGIYGATIVTMTHNDAWYFMETGRLLERADKVSRILDVKYFLVPDLEELSTAVNELQWSALLQSVSALEMYRQQFGRLSPIKVIRFLLLDAHFPRSIRYCIQHAERALHALDVDGRSHPRNEAERRLGQLRASLDFGRVEEILDMGLHEWVDRLQVQLNDIGGEIQKAFFSADPTESPTSNVQTQTLF